MTKQEKVLRDSEAFVRQMTERMNGKVEHEKVLKKVAKQVAKAVSVQVSA